VTETIAVPVKKLDSFSEFADKEIDLFWIDVQGFELSVFKGAERVLKNAKGIFLELNGTGTPYDGAPHYTVIEKYLQDNGFHLAHRELGQNNHEDGGVALYVRDKRILDLFSPESVAARMDVLAKQLAKRERIIKSSWYRLGSKYIPASIKASLKKYFR
jgi:hypothetical protein